MIHMPQQGAPGSDVTKRVVVVDDEEIVLASIRSLLHVETDYQVACFTDPRQALEHVRREGADLVLVDYLMEGMDGIQFLSRVREISPETTRVLLTGYADKESAVLAINSVGLFHYIEKPWENDKLLLVIRNGLERSYLLRKLREKVSDLGEANNDLKEAQRKLLEAFV
jgi:DNA-binding NtrC family response regulator